MSPDERKNLPENQIIRTSSRLGQTITLEGNLTGHEDLEIHGTFAGQINLALHDLIIQKTSRVKADIKAKSLILHGQLEGKVTAERVMISETGNFIGDIITCKISVQNGARFRGTIKVNKEYQP
ncbi:MAG: polymer-forming cytoskeletal protein [Candidatus Saccharicenans sp.]|nr:polymer-forming cytoskeletal protein [Candidatus Saccharicenans sp.]